MSSSWRALAPVMAPAVLGAVVGTGLAVVVNLATGGGPWWLWALVVALTAAGCGTSLWLYRRQSATPPAPPPSSTGSVEASGPRSVAVGRDAGPISTGDNPAPAPPVPAPQPPRDPAEPGPAPGSVSAAGERSVAIGRDAQGPISTGDQHGPASP
ncbi:hypothetical protein [Nocardia abscessus]|uniref:hypothetical protein n=1 Tax=Nocardia abscessus TaxID=120957 RepID=UPI0024540670|nr:hypothetical protein [Nocardia abscessus]